MFLYYSSLIIESKKGGMWKCARLLQKVLEEIIPYGLISSSFTWPLCKAENNYEAIKY